MIRRKKAWASADVLARVAARSRRIGDDEMGDRIQWIRSYVVQEDDGTLGTICIYSAAGPEAILEHAAKVGMPADEIVAVADTVVVRPDPAPAAASRAER